ncbi:MAG: energy transducer TonB [Candidatus Omnitrophica bacterium]|nr:energy transducer TonB [Candidatus Omnitrophota bacterium]
MPNDPAIKIAFLISLTGHLLLFGIPEDFFKFKSKVESPEEVVVRIKIETPPLLPKIEKISKEKKLKEEKISEPRVREVMPEPLPLEKIISRVKPKFENPILPEPKDEREIGKIALVKPEPLEIEVLNPAKEAMLRYQDMVKQRIESCRRYPIQAKRQGLEGISHLTFIVLSNGNAQKIKLLDSSGFQILDKEAIATIKRANPFSPIPKEINLSSVQMEVSLVFTLK